MNQNRLLLFFIIACAVACSMAPVLGKKANSSQFADGVYDGEYSSFPNSAKVRVTIENSKIVKVELLKHIGSSRGNEAEPIIPQRIIEEQSTDVDAVSGATNSSRVIMNAAWDAISKSLKGKSTSTGASE
ncbi:MAG: FMN-binding protein [Proteobacteria bacterium]|nr:FMN-binding protein [Pseudomonadota bacterium]